MMSRKRAAEGPLVQQNMDARHASLVQDFLLLENEYVALKQRLQAAKMRKATLSAEVRFLRRRSKKLKKNSSFLKQNEASEISLRDGSATQKGSVAGPSFLSPKNSLMGSDEITPFQHPFDIDESAMPRASNANIRLVSAMKPSGFTSKADPLLTEMAGKRKISWQDQISLECN